MDKVVPREDLERASRLVSWMASYLANMAPGRYADCYVDLNEHFMAMSRLGIPMGDPSSPMEG